MPWWVVQTETQREHTVRVLLMRHQFETYAPRCKVHGRIAMLFPSYVFVQSGPRFYPILWTQGVVRMLMAGERPACLADHVIDDVRKREIGGFVKLPQRQARILKKGDGVRVIKNSSFAGLTGLYEGMSSHQRARVLLELLGRKVQVELNQSEVEPLDVVASSEFPR